MDRTLIAILALGGVVIVATLAVGSRQRPRTEVPLKDRRFLHCPECHLEVSYSEKAEEEGCKRCGPDVELVATRDRLRDTGPSPSPLVRLLVPVFLEANLLLAAVIWYVLAKRKRSGQEEDYLYTECGSCRKRLRYLVSRVGHPGKCPRCKFAFVFPSPPEEEGARPWWKSWPWGKPTRGSA